MDGVSFRHEEIKDILDEAYVYPMVMHVFCLSLKFSAGFVIPDNIEYNLILSTFHNICILISSP